MLVLYILLFILLFHSLENSLHILSCSFNVGKFKALISTYFIKDDFLNMSAGNKDWDALFGQWIGKWTILCCYSIGRYDIKNSILSVFLPCNIVLQTEKSLLSIQLISVEISYIFLKVRINTSFFQKNTEILIPYIILCRILFSLIFQ